MAKYERNLKGNFNELLSIIEEGILHGSISASYEDGSNFEKDGVSCAIRVYERYSCFGGNRVSLNVTLVGKDEDLFISAITSGGSQAVLFKINTLGEESFLDKLKEIIENYNG
ncbi:hypothetical protein JYG23_05350 [Sedimentibacter sp. zth1]|uniref:DUF6054 family protein n=1 Tax=Sedimentibacter sp. zth1 TaxID=2816908 RepID=UPI001A9333B5|nr:DUF6054 family protein [Sedimentibacter sp. zth1]QSX06874.1 hypothetical protein JYG23_05350 [Sedimentibacter sp. zth1]